MDSIGDQVQNDTNRLNSNTHTSLSQSSTSCSNTIVIKDISLLNSLDKEIESIEQWQIHKEVVLKNWDSNDNNSTMKLTIPVVHEIRQDYMTEDESYFSKYQFLISIQK